MAKIRRGKHKGETVKLHQWCNNWFSVELKDKIRLIVSPTNLIFTGEEMADVLLTKNNGLLLGLFEPLDNTFKKRRRK